MAVALTYASTMTVVETFSAAQAPAAAAGSNTITHALFNGSQSLNAGTTVPVSAVAAFNKPLVAGAATIDLTVLPQTGGGTFSGNGLYVRAIKFIADAANANPITIKFGAANPYNLFGASWQIILSAGMEFLAFLVSGAPQIAAGAKNIDLSGTGVQDVNVIIVLG